MKLTAYPRYKPSGVEWLGDVPEHWDVKRLSYLATLKSGENITSEMIAEGGDYPVYGGNGLRGNYHKFTHRGHHALIGRQGALCGNINYASGEFYASEHALVVSPLKEFVVVWMGELLRAMNLGQYSVTAAQPGIAAEMIRGLRIPVPPLAEQRAIATFLDRVTGRVDRLVAKKRELIERLKEKRTALISRTVTRGLPSAAARAAGLSENPPLKPSGVPWFDEYPSHWQTKRLRHISDFIVVGVVVNPSSYVTDEGVFFLLGGDVREMRIDTTNCKRCSAESSNGPLVKSRLDAGDLVVVRVGYPGVAAVVPPDLAGSNVASMMLVRKHQRYCSQWLAYAFNSQVGRDQVEIVQYGAAQKQFNISHAVDFAFPFPPLPEQTAIAAYLDAETAKLDALVGKVEAAVERLQEYRTALITAAVTGKIDVRKKVGS